MVQRHSLAEVNAPFIRRLAAIPALAGFVAAADERLAQPGAAIETCREAFSDLLRSDFLQQLVRGELAAMAADLRHDVHDAFGTAWLIVTREHFSLEIKIYPPKDREPPGRALVTQGHHSLVGVAGTGCLQLQTFCTPAAHDPNVLNPAERLTPGPRLALRRGELLHVRPGRDVVRVEPHPDPIACCILRQPEVHARTQMFDPDRLAPTLAVAARDTDSRVQIAAEVLATLRHAPAVPVLARVAASPSHFVRWAALRHMAAIDAAAALPHLRRALDDAHPHIRRAAALALAS